MRIQGYDHVGIRVSDRDRALRFYEKLGFRLDPEYSSDNGAEMLAPDGTRINLICNGVPREGAHNILLDEPTKWPGYTHAAFIVDSLHALLDFASAEGIEITEGPHDWGRRFTCSALRMRIRPSIRSLNSSVTWRASSRLRIT